MIVIEKDFIPPQICEEMISLYNRNKRRMYKHDYSFPLHIDDLSFQDKDDLKRLAFRHLAKCSSVYGDDIYLQSYEIVRWPKNSKKDFHYDSGMEDTCLASITYLNDGYRGGETLFEDDLSIKPCIGKTIFFDGNRYHHAVNRVAGGDRYTIAIWYTHNLLRAK